MPIEISGETRNEIARTLFNCATILSHYGKPVSPEGIRAQIAECNAVLRKIGCSDMVDGMPRVPSILDEL
jgi:hypothetical protein